MLANSCVLLPAFPAALLEPRPSPRFFHARQRERDTLLVAAAPVCFHHPSPFPRPRALRPATPSSAANSRLGERGEIVPSRSHLHRHLFFLHISSFHAPRPPLSPLGFSPGSRLGRVVAPVPSLFFRVFSRTWRGLPPRVTCYPDTMGSRTQTCKMARPTVATQTPSSLAAAVETGLHARFDVSSR